MWSTKVNRVCNSSGKRWPSWGRRPQSAEPGCPSALKTLWNTVTRTQMRIFCVKDRRSLAKTLSGKIILWNVFVLYLNLESDNRRFWLCETFPILTFKQDVLIFSDDTCKWFILTYDSSGNRWGVLLQSWGIHRNDDTQLQLSLCTFLCIWMLYKLSLVVHSSRWSVFISTRSDVIHISVFWKQTRVNK